MNPVIVCKIRYNLNMFKFIKKLLAAFKTDKQPQESSINEQRVIDSIKQHRDALNKLEKYDTGKISKTKKVAHSKTVQEYLRNLQKKSKKIRLDGRASLSNFWKIY